LELSVNQNILNTLVFYLGNEYFILFLLSMLPVTELRLSVPIGVLLFKLPALYVFMVCTISNILIGIILILTLDKIILLMEKNNFANNFFINLKSSSKRKYSKYEKFKLKGLTLFVGIPFPGTGVWTGSLISRILFLSKGNSISSIIQGVIISGTIMTFLSLTGKIIL